MVVPQTDEDAMPELGSVTLHVTVTLALFHPLAFGAGLMVEVMTGGEVSVVNLKK